MVPEYDFVSLIILAWYLYNAAYQAIWDCLTA